MAYLFVEGSRTSCATIVVEFLRNSYTIKIKRRAPIIVPDAGIRCSVPMLNLTPEPDVRVSLNL